MICGRPNPPPPFPKGKGVFLTFLLSVTATGCASVSFNSTVYQKQRFALAAFYGPVRIDTSAVGVAGAFQTGNDWGAKMAEGVVDDVRAHIERALGSPLLPIDQMIQAAGYASAVPIPGAEQFGSPRGMKPLSVEHDNDALLGALAAGLGVEAVIVISNDWSVRRAPGTADQYGFDAMHLIIVGVGGKRLWDQTEEVEARGDWVYKQAGINMAGAASPDLAQAMARAAVLQGVDRFAVAWAANRK
jgi:hypothetical protein